MSFHQTFLEEAENERMHLMTALELKEPGILFRGVILLAQGKLYKKIISPLIFKTYCV